MLSISGRRKIFGWDANPAIDPPKCRKSHSYCNEEVLSGRADWLPDGSGIWERAPGNEMRHVDETGFIPAGTPREAWKILPSGGFMVLQMPSRAL